MVGNLNKQRIKIIQCKIRIDLHSVTTKTKSDSSNIARQASTIFLPFPVPILVRRRHRHRTSAAASAACQTNTILPSALLTPVRARKNEFRVGGSVPSVLEKRCERPKQPTKGIKKQNDFKKGVQNRSKCSIFNISGPPAACRSLQGDTLCEPRGTGPPGFPSPASVQCSSLLERVPCRRHQREAAREAWPGGRPACISGAASHAAPPCCTAANFPRPSVIAVGGVGGGSTAGSRCGGERHVATQGCRRPGPGRRTDRSRPVGRQQSVDPGYMSRKMRKFRTDKFDT